MAPGQPHEYYLRHLDRKYGEVTPPAIAWGPLGDESVKSESE